MESHKTFRAWEPGRYVQQPFTPAEVLPEDDLVFFLLDVVPSLDLSAMYAYYERETRGAPPFDVAMMATLLLYIAWGCFPAARWRPPANATWPS